MIYLDSSALLKLLFTEMESDALTAWLTDRSDSSLVSSELATVEVLRATRRLDDRLVPAARALLAGLDLVPLSRGLVDAAADIAPPLLRSLDALHLASMSAVGRDLDAVVAYDARLIVAAESVGLLVVTPTD